MAKKKVATVGEYSKEERKLRKAMGGSRSVASNFRGLGQGKRYPTRKMIQKQRNKAKAKLGRTR